MRSFANIMTISRRELGAYFKSPVAYIVVAVFAVLTGYLFFDKLFMYKNANMDQFFGNMPFMLMFFAPAMAMRLLAEERGSGTIELLLTMPVRDWEVVVGKYLAGLGLLAVCLLVTIPFAITVGKLGPLDKGPVIGGYLGTLFLGGTYLAVGLLISAMTRNQIVSFVVSLAICFVLYILPQLVRPAGGTVGPVLQYISPGFHFDGIARGVIEIRSVVYYLSAIAVILIGSVQVLESRKWR